MKAIKTTHIDTGGHGYLSVSQKDFLVVMGGELDQISHFSGINLTRVFLEEDCDASMFMERAQDKGIPVDVKSSYNPKFNISHNYSPEYIGFKFDVNDRVMLHSSGAARVVSNDPVIMVLTETGRTYRIPKTNPFYWIKGVIK